jgi:hypothetical protein
MRSTLVTATICLACSNLATAQEPTPPRVIALNGVATDSSGQPITRVVAVTFGVYTEQTGGAPLWVEIQVVQPNAQGHYWVTLGSTQPEGLPLELFSTGEARWLGVQIEGQLEQPRMLLASVPYALKAGDANTVGGLPASAFLLAAGSHAPSTSTGSSRGASSPAADGEPTRNGTPTPLDQVILDDLIVVGKECLGTDCVNGEAFGPENSRLKKGDTPELRLVQTNTGSFSPWTWGVAGNEANFFTRDVTGGGTLPFRILPGAPTSSLVVSSTGSVGIGTSNPTNKLTVAGGIELSATGFPGSGDGIYKGAAGQLGLVTGGTPRLYVSGGNVGIGTTNPINKLTVAGGIELSAIGFPGAGDGIYKGAAGQLGFVTSGTPRLYISGGNVGIGTTNPAQALSVVGNVEVDGAIVQTSDARAKEQIKTIDNPLGKVMRLRGVEFKWRKDRVPPASDHGVQIGFIAQEVEPVVPAVVRTDPDGLKSVAYANITALLIEAVKEQQAEIARLRTEIDALRAEIRVTR